MSRTVTVVTPENIEVTYQLGGFASRFVAIMIDMAIQALVVIGIYALISEVASSRVTFGSISRLFVGIGIVAVYLVIVAYPIFFEMAWGGRTPGKRLLGLRVIRNGGYGVNFTASLIRNVLRPVDIGLIPLPTPVVLFGFPGMASVFFSPLYMRIGDIAAGTIVIVEAGATPFSSARSNARLSPAAAYFLPAIKNLDRLTADEYRMIRRFTERRVELDILVQASIGERLARPIMEKLDLDIPIMYQIQYADVLSAIERRYAEERGAL